MTLLLLTISTLTIAAGCLRFGWNSVVTFGLLGNYIYSVPGFIGLTAPFHRTMGAAGIFDRLSEDTLVALCFVWITLFTMTVVMPVPCRRTEEEAVFFEPHWRSYLAACVIISVAGFIVITSRLGPLYFLQERSTIELGMVSLLWRWTLIFGLVIAVRLKSWASVLLFVAGLAIYFTAGDRTIPAISIAATIITLSVLGRRRKLAPPLSYLIIGLLAFGFLLIGKPIYLAAKTQSVESFHIFLNFDAVVGAVLSFEPVITINILDYSINNQLTMPLSDFIISVLGNFLIMPSAFGVDTNYFNTFFTAEMPRSITFGLAGNFYAHGYVVFGFFGFVLFATLFFLALYSIEAKLESAIGMSKLVFIVIGATIAIYLQRNGVDNILSFVRQILIVALMIWLVGEFWRTALPRKSHA